MDLAHILSPVTADMRAVDELIHEQLSSDVVLINQLSHYIVNSGGKRLRPALALLAARAGGYQGTDHILLAAIVEFIHTATLLHDDVVDASELRRGGKTANAIWGNEASVLTGDFLYTRAFQMMVRLGRARVFEVMADTTNAIAEGEVLQLLHCRDPEVSEARYRDVIQRKTARLFQAGSQLGGVLADLSPAGETALADYGLHLGNAFQLVDDALDYSDSAGAMGKNAGDDLAEGKVTLPLIYGLKQGSPEQVTEIRAAIENGGLDRIDGVRRVIESTGAIEYTLRLAAGESRAAVDAITGLPESAHKRAMVSLADFAVGRHY